MTDHLYYDDARLTRFEATITAREERDGVLIVSLDQTAFYPTSGGQPHDMGTLNGIPVTDVWVTDDDTIWHQVERFPESDNAVGEIDWQRRFDLMQQHTGQHILSAAFDELYKAATIGFHLSDEYATIDLDMPKCSWKQAFAVEELANKVVFDNAPVTKRTITQDEKDSINFRKAPVVEGDLRVIFAGDFDACACGGTHVAYTGEIGLIKITGIERNKQGVRVTFQCGARALKHYQEILQTAQAASKTLSVGVVELPQAVGRLQDELKTVQRAYKKANISLQTLNAAQLWEQTPEVDDRKTITLVWEDGDFADLRLVVNQMRDHPRTVILAAVLEAKGLRMVCARSDDLPDVDARVLFKTAADTLGVRGGGPPSMVQGGGPVHTKDEIEQAFIAALA